MFQLIYLSFASDEFNFERDFDNILTKSRSNNSKDDITGMLLFSGGAFLQLLEGPKHKVKSTFERVLKDKRHSNVFLILESSENERIFSHWTMCSRKSKEITIDDFDDFIPWSDIISSTKSGSNVSNETILQLIKKFKYFKKNELES